MPLKHVTETALLVLLALVTIVTGVVVSTLPHLPGGFLPWVGTFVATVLYPAIVYPTLKNNRADNAFRALHFAPVTITLVWMFLEIVLLKEPRFLGLMNVFTWGWSAAAVILTFLLIAIFCLQVLRRWPVRVGLLALLLVPFFLSGYASEGSQRWDAKLASILWNTPQLTGIAMQPGSSASSMRAVSSKGEKNLASSSLPEEEAWRQKLRDVEQGKVHSSSSVIVSIRSTMQGVSAAFRLSGAASSSASRQGTTHVAVKPRTSLPHAGGEFEALAVFFVAGYCGVMHQRARRRLV